MSSQVITKINYFIESLVWFLSVFAKCKVKQIALSRTHS